MHLPSRKMITLAKSSRKDSEAKIKPTMIYISLGEDVFSDDEVLAENIFATSL